ncbi:MAG: maleylpyruvate isomerase family mycothiol-dependent enzyme [Nocardioides sp.]
MSLWDDLAQERLAIADRLDTLTSEQWQVPSLCSAWDVKGVAAHLLTTAEFTRTELLGGMLKARGNVDRFQVLLAADRANLGTAELTARMRSSAAARKAPPVVGVIGPYTDALVHQLDMWIPLGLVDDRPVERWRPTLDFLVSAKARVGFLPGRAPALWYQATDLEWQHGTGDVVSAPAAALALALLGRTARLDELDGPGADGLRAWATGG